MDEYYVQSPEEIKGEEDFFTAATLTSELLLEFVERDLMRGPALDGAITQILTILLIESDDYKAAMELLAQSLENASFHADTIKLQESKDKPQIH